MTVLCSRVLASALTAISGVSVGADVLVMGALLAATAALVAVQLRPRRGSSRAHAEAMPATSASRGPGVLDLPDEVTAEIRALAREADRPVEEVVLEAVRRHREDLAAAGLLGAR